MAHKLDDFTIEIQDWREKALQRALWKKETSRLGTINVIWCDIEITVDDGGREDSKRLDLVGVGDDDSLVLCELKFNRSDDSPNDAAKQVSEYRDYILTHPESLGQHKKAKHRGMLDWTNLVKKPIHLVLAANSTYWHHWKRKWGNEWEDRLASIEHNNITCYALQIDDDFFKKQKEKNGKKTYTPEITEEQNIWTPVDL